jgi:hypothetical protein
VEPNRLFLETCADLESRLPRLDEYGILRAAALMRQLLLDDQRLVDQVNRTARLKLVFDVRDSRNYMQMVIGDGAAFYSVEDGLDPATGRPGSTVELNRDQFLKWQVMFVDGHYVTIHDVIDQLAHIEGGVHVGTAKTGKEKALAEAGKTFGIGGLPAGIRMTAAIARVVLKALRPLRDQVAQS